MWSRRDEESEGQPGIAKARAKRRVDEEVAGEQVETESSDVAGAVPRAGDEIENAGEFLAEDQKQTDHPEVNAALRMPPAEQKEQGEKDAEGNGIWDEVKVHTGGCEYLMSAGAAGS